MIATRFGEFAAALRCEALPGEVVGAVKLRVMDVLGAALAGYGFGTVEALRPVLGAGDDATMWGSGRRLTLRDAALVNSFMSHACYMEDGSRFTGGHPSSVVIPPLLVLAEARRVSGAALIAAIVAGYEVFLRLGRAMYPSIVNRGYQSTAVLGGVSAAAGCASLLGLSPVAAGHAIAIGATLGGGLKAAGKSPALHPLQVGRGAESGLIAALLAEAGSEGVPTVLEEGFLRGFADGVDADAIVAGLGREYRLGELYLKRHGGCRGNHAPIDVVERLVREHGVGVDDIAGIDLTVDTVTLAAEVHEPKDGMQAQLSIRYAVAANLVFGDALPPRYTDACLGDPALRAVMARIEATADPALDAGFPARRPANAVITLCDGRVLKGGIDNARGEPEDPLSAADVRMKARALALPHLGAERVEALFARIDRLETLDDAGRIAPLLVATTAAGPG